VADTTRDAVVSACWVVAGEGTDARALSEWRKWVTRCKADPETGR
jgi:hypothetical protein